jgi:hypothetical protein
MIEIDFESGPFPSPEEYRAALESISKKLTPKQRQLLLHHYKAPEHTATSKQLAQAVGYKSSNLQYGLLASLLCKALGKTVNNDLVYILLTTKTRKSKGIERKLTMRPQVVQAIDSLKWK